MAHSAEVSFAFLADVGGEEDGDGGSELGVLHGGGDGEECGEAGGVVAGTGGKDASILFEGLGGGG
jgi:hypothetical protein